VQHSRCRQEDANHEDPVRFANVDPRQQVIAVAAAAAAIGTCHRPQGQPQQAAKLFTLALSVMRAGTPWEHTTGWMSHPPGQRKEQR
jgi:hypothetical protein